MYFVVKDCVRTLLWHGGSNVAGGAWVGLDLAWMPSAVGAEQLQQYRTE
jgi:hypothetical protein